MLDKILKFISYITATTLVSLVLLILYDATSRYLFSEGSTALQELEWHFFDVVILLSIAYTLKHNAHVRVDIFYDKFSPKSQLVIDMLAFLLFILPFSLLIVYISLGFVELSFVQHEASSDPGGLTNRWIIKSLMPLAFILVSIQALVEFFKSLQKWKSL